MRKLIFSAMAIMLIASSVAFAQKTRTVGVYFDANSGQLNQSDGTSSVSDDFSTFSSTAVQNLFADNEFEFGAWYRQNFEAAEWLTFEFKALAVVKQMGLSETGEFTENDSGIGGTTKPNKYKGLDASHWYNNTPAGSPRARVGLMLNSTPLGFDGLAVNLFFDTRTLGVFEAYYTIGFGNAGALTLGAFVEFYANPLTVSSTYTDDAGETQNMYAAKVLDVFGIRVQYSVPFAEIWSFTSQANFRFGGPTTDGYSVRITDTVTQEIIDPYEAIKTWEDNFAMGFHIRWDNTIAVNVGGLGLWASVRYELFNALANKVEIKDYSTNPDGESQATKEYLSLGILHSVKLRAGVSYSFDLSGL